MGYTTKYILCGNRGEVEGEINSGMESNDTGTSVGIGQTGEGVTKDGSFSCLPPSVVGDSVVA
jgi:hypothetical protein